MRTAAVGWHADTYMVVVVLVVERLWQRRQETALKCPLDRRKISKNLPCLSPIYLVLVRNDRFHAH